jgi:hypothetical protein
MSEIRVSQSLSVYQIKEESAFPVPVSEWKRLRSKIEAICPQRRIYQNLASVFWGIFASAILALIAFYAGANSLEPWVLPTAWAVLVGSAVLGVVLLVLDDQQKLVIAQSTKIVLDDMTALEQKHQMT